MRHLISEVLRFGAVGGTATLAHAVGYLLCLSILSPQVSNVCGFAIAFIISYFGHNHFSFRDSNQARPTAMRFGAVALLGFALNAWFVQFADQLLNAPKLAFWFIAFVTPALTYLLLKFWVFKGG